MIVGGLPARCDSSDVPTITASPGLVLLVLADQA